MLCTLLGTLIVFGGVVTYLAELLGKWLDK